MNLKLYGEIENIGDKVSTGTFSFGDIFKHQCASSSLFTHIGFMQCLSVEGKPNRQNPIYITRRTITVIFSLKSDQS